MTMVVLLGVAKSVDFSQNTHLETSKGTNVNFVCLFVQFLLSFFRCYLWTQLRKKAQ